MISIAIRGKLPYPLAQFCSLPGADPRGLSLAWHYVPMGGMNAANILKTYAQYLSIPTRRRGTLNIRILRFFFHGNQSWPSTWVEMVLINKLYIHSYISPG